MNAKMDRRDLLALLGFGVAANQLEAMQHAMHSLQQDPAKYTLQFFSPVQDRLIEHVAELIIPADEHSGGAKAAHVSYYVDLIIKNSTPEMQARWSTGLAAFENFSKTRKGKSFVDLTPAEQSDVLNQLAQSSKHPEQPAEMFFADMKRITIAGYYTSKIGLIDELGYIGNEVLGSFGGCHFPRNG
jgi:gluconate 2-dehydrogenase gamma chain